MRSLTFRQFNVVGAGDHQYAADTGPTSLLPAIFHAMTDGPDLTVRGIDYPTFDSSAIRDYVHVIDVAQAYLKGVEYLSRRGFPWHRHKVVNVGSGVGNSVFEVVRIASEVAHISVPYQVGPRRLGDAAAVVADVSRARRFVGPGQLSLTDAIASAWASWQKDVTVESYR